MRGIAYSSDPVTGNGAQGSKTARNVADNNLGRSFSGGTIIGVTAQWFNFRIKCHRTSAFNKTRQPLESLCFGRCLLFK